MVRQDPCRTGANLCETVLRRKYKSHPASHFFPCARRPCPEHCKRGRNQISDRATLPRHPGLAPGPSMLRVRGDPGLSPLRPSVLGPGVTAVGGEAEVGSRVRRAVARDNAGHRRAGRRREAEGPSAVMPEAVRPVRQSDEAKPRTPANFLAARLQGQRRA
ncbi:hypothetical protein SAMN04487974_101643 [Pelagibacterium luteolum]|uniref:Uncharacterized protein n=1 Tax=Pelagibacterium luteolum TaxID=440168 RepID=A0A1G7SQ03_9HYPH|nr:hypothetical protein SAMN04487974_101643 [Pelagibacterium luteolum]